MHLVDLLWTLVVIFFMVVYFLILFRVILDVFRSDDLSGWVKALWFLGLLLVPLLSLLLYVITRGDGMTKRDQHQLVQMQQAQEQYIRGVTGASGGSGGAAEEIARGHALLTSGAITQAEFDALKSKALNG
jgi:ABC-type multidrug transport system fused ATPase/permease subunit